MQLIQASYIFHRNEQRIKLQFENYGALNKLIKSIPGARWSKTYKSWHIACDKKLYSSFKKSLPAGCTLTEIKKSDALVPLQIKASPPSVTCLTAIPAMPATKGLQPQYY